MGLVEDLGSKVGWVDVRSTGPRWYVELAEELADVALYLLQLASVSGIDLEEAIIKKLEINAKREWDLD